MNARHHSRSAGAERQARYVHSGRAIACVIRDPDARWALEILIAKYGGVTAAVTAALVAAITATYQRGK